MATIDELLKSRKQKLKKLEELGINPYPSQALHKQHILKARDMLTEKVEVTGRIIAIRGHGKLIFHDIIDETGKIQIAFKSDNMKGQIYSLLSQVDIGDFIAVQGLVNKTVAGEVTVFANNFQIITKSIRPLPDKWHGLKDIEERYRKRYLDLILNKEVKDRLTKRSEIISVMRNFLNNQGYIEVETPTLQAVYGGGFARPFKTHHNVLDSDFYLRISDEMYLKRLIVGGFEKVYEITKVFRNEGIDHDHNPEFTMFEAQIAYEDYFYGMDITEELIEHIAKQVIGKTKFVYQSIEMDVKRPWIRMKMADAVKKYTGVDPLAWGSLNDASNNIRKMGIPEDKLNDLKRIHTVGECIAFVFEHMVEKELIQPTIIYDFPVEVSPLAKKCADPRFTQRFELFAFGSELGNNYSELNDPIDLKKRFIEEKKREEAGFAEAQQMDFDYIEAIEHGFPPTCGLGIGVDRLVMLFTDAKSIKEVIAFPTLRPVTQEKNAPDKNVNFILKPDYINIDPEVKKTNPTVSIGIALIKGVKIRKSNPELEKEKDNLLKSLIGLSTETLGTYKEILSYRKLYKEMGIDWHSRRPSPEALLRRVVLGKGLYTVNTCVDAYNLVVMKHRVSVGAFDADKIRFPAVLKYASGNDTILLLGDDKPTRYTSKELAYYDQVGGYNIDFNYRDAQRTMVTEKTSNIWINVDGIYDITPEEVERSLNESVELIIKYCGGKVEFKGVVI